MLFNIYIYIKQYTIYICETIATNKIMYISIFPQSFLMPLYFHASYFVLQ